MSQYQGPLTPKEQKVVDEFDKARPGMGDQVEKGIRSPDTGFREIIADTPVNELVLRQPQVSKGDIK